MTLRAMFLILCVGASACAHAPRWLGGNPESGVESLYVRALGHLDSARTEVSVDSAIYLLDSYLVSSHKQRHRREAMVLRHLAASTQRLTRLEADLQRTLAGGERSASGGAEPRREAEPRRSEDASAEIQRLRSELAKANAELERIRKRLTNPKEP